jgi:CDP-4-dehydro-6-deoxyglucose reductase, E1
MAKLSPKLPSKRLDYRYELSNDTLNELEKEAAIEVLSSGKYTMGERTFEFERQFANWVGSKYATMVTSGSAANLIITEALLRSTGDQVKLMPGDEVIVPALTWSTTVWPIIQLGLKPVFVDSDPNTLAIDLKSAESVMSERVKAMYLVPVLGCLPDMDPYVEFCKAYDIVLIEDVCESLGSFYNEKHAGSFGLLGSFSLYFSHHITSIEGGMVITDEKSLKDDLCSFRSHGGIRDRSDRKLISDMYPALDERFLFITSGYNLRPTEVQAAIGLIQLEKLDLMLQQREMLAAKLNDLLLTNAPWLKLIGREALSSELPIKDRHKRQHSWMAFPMMIATDAPITSTELKSYFEASGVETRPIIAGNLTRHPACDKVDYRKADQLTICDATISSGFMIGCHPNPGEQSLECLVNCIEGLVQFNV